MDLSESIVSKSDQIDYQDFLGGERVVTVKEVRPGPSAEQPVEVVLDEFDRPWRPAKSMRRVLVAAWGADSQHYIGRRILLFGDPTVKWAGNAVGGDQGARPLRPNRATDGRFDGHAGQACPVHSAAPP